ncbi:MAG: dephospho-CoA kinase [Verrucomicrobiaceae bacterium]|nr:dephospho-CoA kinase [Verrucomicrobiaceae bacterium]
MKTLIVTGGIGCGKSSVAALLCSLFRNASILRYSADESVHAAYERPEVRSRIADALEIGDAEQFSSGRDFREVVRSRVVAQKNARSRLEAVLHPVVRRSFIEVKEAAIRKGVKLLVAEIPLYYETGGAFESEGVLVVAASRLTQLHRLQFYRSLDLQTAEEMLSMQMPMDEKIQRADFVVWNDGSLDALKVELSVLYQAVS